MQCVCVSWTKLAFSIYINKWPVMRICILVWCAARWKWNRLKRDYLILLLNYANENCGSVFRDYCCGCETVFFCPSLLVPHREQLAKWFLDISSHWTREYKRKAQIELSESDQFSTQQIHQRIRLSYSSIMLNWFRCFSQPLLTNLSGGHFSMLSHLFKQMVVNEMYENYFH